MTTLINDASTPLSRLNIFDDPLPWDQVKVAGILITALAVKFNGFQVQDAWKKQKSKDASGAVFSFNGTDPVGGESGFSITFRIATREDFDQLYDLYDALKPVPGTGGGGVGSTGTSGGSGWTSKSTAVGSPPKAPDASADQLLAQAQAALNALNNPKPAASSEDPADAQKAATTPQPSPGPRPPTVPIELGWLAFLGVFAVARKSWEFSTIEQDHIEVTVGFVQDAPPKPAGTGAMGAPKPSVGAGFTSGRNQQIAKAGAKAGATGT